MNSTQMAKDTDASFEVRLVFRPEDPQSIIVSSNDAIIQLNIAGVSGNKPAEMSQSVTKLVDQVKTLVANRPGRLVANVSPHYVNNNLLARLSDERVDLGQIDRIRNVLSIMTTQLREVRQPLPLDDDHPRYRIESHPVLLRYGNVELRVVENYLRDKAGLETALASVLGDANDETKMYRPGTLGHYLDTSDIGWNLRKLMTNAGFYVGSDLKTAMRAVEDWAERYIAALRSATLATYPDAYPFHFANQWMLWKNWGVRPNYVRHPNVFGVYSEISGKKILFMSPLAKVVAEQVRSGRLWSLYRKHTVPAFELRTVSSWISTWPNCPHRDWSDTFAHMCETIDKEYKHSPFDVFISSCGSYGLPVSDYVRQTYGCAVIYVGNISNAYFGVKQTATRDFMKDHVNAAAWAHGDLGQFANVDRIDGGRYV